MKLMPVIEAKKATDAQTQMDIVRANEVKSELKHALSEMEKAESMFKLALANQHVHYINDETEHQKAIGSLINEIRVLEKNRAELLIPIDKEKEEAHNMFVQAEKSRNKNRDAEIALEEKAEMLETRLDDASEQLEALTRRTAELNRREAGIKKQGDMTQRYCEEMTSKVDLKVASCAEQEKEIAQQMKELQFKEISLRSQQESINLQQDFIIKEKIRLNDREQVLEHEINKLQHGK
jgi:chromosome segregation ATPase